MDELRIPTHPDDVGAEKPTELVEGPLGWYMVLRAGTAKVMVDPRFGRPPVDDPALARYAEQQVCQWSPGYSRNKTPVFLVMNMALQALHYMASEDDALFGAFVDEAKEFWSSIAVEPEDGPSEATGTEKTGAGDVA